MNNFLIIGVGNLGERSIQAIQGDFLDANIFISETNTSRANYITKKYGVEVFSGQISIDELDFVHISTTSTGRQKIITDLNFGGSSLILVEKPTASNLSELLQQASKKSNKNLFVNLPRRIFPINIYLKNYINCPFEIIVEMRNLNIFSNISHFIDLSRFLGAKGDYSIEVNSLKEKKSKRQGYIDFSGTLKLLFQCGSSIYLIDENKTERSVLTLKNKDLFLQYDESQVELKKCEGIDLDFDFDRINVAPYHSQLLSKVLKNYQSMKVCHLTSLKEVATDNINIFKFLHKYKGVGLDQDLLIS